MRLSDTTIRNAKPTAKPIKLFDGGGLYLEVSPTGSRYWRIKFRVHGVERRLSLGVYPETSLRLARERREDLRRQLAAGIDPSAQRKAVKSARAEAVANSFESLALEWHDKTKAKWSDSHAGKVMDRLQRDVFGWIGARPITEVSASELLALLRRIEARGAVETAHRVSRICGQVFRYAIASERAKRNPQADLRGALPSAKERHLASITEPTRVGQLLRALHGYGGHFMTACALQLAPLVFVRPGELRAAEWAEFDLDGAEWRIPAERMKVKEAPPHIVPLAVQAVAILRELQALTGTGRYVFPSVRTRTRPMSNNTVNAALRRLGYTKDEMTGHGFRSMASTLLNEQGWTGDAIERQLAHRERNKVRAAYNYAEHLPERRRMMQAWADYLDGLRSGAEVVPIKRATSS